MAGLVLSAAPASEPVTTAEAKSHLRVDDSDSDTLIDTYVAAARAAVEAFTKRALFTQTWVYRIDYAFPTQIRLPIGPVQSISSIVYVADDGTSTTLATSDYRTALNGETGVIEPAWGKTWPSARTVLDAIAVTFIAGESDTANIPKAIRHALLMLVAHYYENREAVLVGQSANEIPLGVKNLLMPWVRFD